MTEPLERAVARALLSIGAVFLSPENPFTWASGIQSPVYCDNRLTLTAPDVRGLIERGLADLITREYPDADALMGTATAGIAHAAIAAHLLNLPMGYVRGGAKDHGRGGRIEGKLQPGWRVVVVEDLISTGGSAIEAAQALREAGARVLGVASLFTYGMRSGLDNLSQAGLRNASLCGFDTLVDVALEQGGISPDQARALRLFRDNPKDEGWRAALGGGRA